LQHIEDLTQEKFALQRGAEAARALAASLEEENSRLTEDFNRQAQAVQALKAELERQQAEITAQQVLSGLQGAVSLVTCALRSVNRRPRQCRRSRRSWRGSRRRSRHSRYVFSILCCKLYSVEYIWSLVRRDLETGGPGGADAYGGLGEAIRRIKALKGFPTFVV
jgi:hypothetical protein